MGSAEQTAKFKDEIAKKIDVLKHVAQHGTKIEASSGDNGELIVMLRFASADIAQKAHALWMPMEPWRCGESTWDQNENAARISYKNPLYPDSTSNEAVAEINRFLREITSNIGKKHATQNGGPDDTQEVPLTQRGLHALGKLLLNIDRLPPTDLMDLAEMANRRGTLLK